RGFVAAQRRVAASLVRDPRTRLLPRHKAAELQARRKIALEPHARQAPAQYAVADARAKKRRALDGLRDARRRRPGPVVDAALSAPCPPRHEFAGGDRLSGIQQRSRAELVLPACGPSRLAAAGGTLSADDSARTSAARAHGALWRDLVGRTPDRLRPRRDAGRHDPEGGRQSSRYADLRRRAISGAHLRTRLLREHTTQ